MCVQVARAMPSCAPHTDLQAGEGAMSGTFFHLDLSRSLTVALQGGFEYNIRL